MTKKKAQVSLKKPVKAEIAKACGKVMDDRRKTTKFY